MRAIKRRASYPGIVTARLIAQGDLTAAREWHKARPIAGLEIAEARAIFGALKHCNRKYGSKLTMAEFLR